MKKIAIITVLFILFAFFFYKKFFITNIPNTKIITIQKGETVKSIAKKLQNEGIVKDWRFFYILTLIKGKTLKYGHYEFSGRISLYYVWEKLYKGKEKLVKFTIIPGEDLIDIGKKLEKQGIITTEKWINFVFNEENVKKYGLKGKSFEGYFPPETYFLPQDIKIDKLVHIFLDQFKKEYFPYKEKFEKKEFDFYKAMIIASLVEKETFIEQEKPIIAGVIINRLKKVMHLQIDPTVIYALKLKNLWNGNLTKENMKIQSPFNTYINYGLPPTPICSFSIESLEAVLEYKEIPYLYYVFDGQKHVFSKTYWEHRKNIIKINRK